MDEILTYYYNSRSAVKIFKVNELLCTYVDYTHHLSFHADIFQNIMCLLTRPSTKHI